MEIKVIVRNKIAKLVKPYVAVCGNSDYVINFDFDAEWGVYETKTARFKYNGSYTDIIFDGNQCSMPVINNTYTVEIGVFAGDIHTTTPALLPMKKSILCGEGSPEEPAPDVYNQIMEKLNNLDTEGYEELKEEIGNLEDLDTETKENLVDVINEVIEQTDVQLAELIREVENKIIQPDYDQNDSTQANFIKNRPFYDASSSTMEQINITWDGDTIGRVQSSGIAVFYKVSDRVFTNEELKQMIYTDTNGEINLSELPEFWFDNDFAALGENGGAVIRIPGTYSSSGSWYKTYFPETGIYFNDNSRSLTSSEPIEITTGVIKQLDAKYIPNNDEHINSLIDAKLGVIENGSY